MLVDAAQIGTRHFWLKAPPQAESQPYPRSGMKTLSSSWVHLRHARGYLNLPLQPPWA